jgi:hypothetical protein
MSQFRTLKINNIIDSNERTRNLKNKTIYNSIKTSTPKKKNGATYNSSIYLDTNGCLGSTNSFDTFLSISKGENLCPTTTPTPTYSIKGQMNEANIIAVDTSGMNLVYPNRTSSADPNTITYPLTYDCSCGNVFQNPGSLVDPSNLLVNKVSCEPYIRNRNPTTNKPIYDLSNTGVITSKESYYARINSTNNQLQKYFLTSKIKLK